MINSRVARTGSSVAAATIYLNRSASEVFPLFATSEKRERPSPAAPRFTAQSLLAAEQLQLVIGEKSAYDPTWRLRVTATIS
uniref:CIA30 domain-containing protein n=1 Tax=Steinernema glaseri TaxID=37863 RepID=A0A1I8A5T7_9BILA